MTSCIQADRLRPPTLLSALERRAEGAGANLCAEVLPGGAYELHRSPARQPAKQDYPIHVLQPFGDDSHRCGEVANAKWTAPCGCRFQPPGTLPRFALYLLTTSTYKTRSTLRGAKEKQLPEIGRPAAVLCAPSRLCVEMLLCGQNDISRCGIIWQCPGHPARRVHLPGRETHSCVFCFTPARVALAKQA